MLLGHAIRLATRGARGNRAAAHVRDDVIDRAQQHQQFRGVPDLRRDRYGALRCASARGDSQFFNPSMPNCNTSPAPGGQRGAMKSLGLAVAIVVAGAPALGALGPGCSHDAKPAVEPDEHPPLPPASGTPIGYLVDATELKLSDDQLAKLKAIDDDLAGKLAALDGQLRGSSPSQSSNQNTGRRRGGGGMRGGGMRGGGMRGGGMRGGGGGSGSGSAAGSGARPRRGAASADTVSHVTEERAADVRDAIDRAMAELDVVQRIVARRVLTEHGVDLDAGRPGTSSQAKPGTPAPAEPDAEPDEPDEPDAGDGSGNH